MHVHCCLRFMGCYRAHCMLRSKRLSKPGGQTAEHGEAICKPGLLPAKFEFAGSCEIFARQDLPPNATELPPNSQLAIRWQLHISAIACCELSHDCVGQQLWHGPGGSYIAAARLLYLPLVHMRTLLLVYLSDSDHLLPQVTRCFSFRCRPCCFTNQRS